jgi:hypothetical protein
MSKDPLATTLWRDETKSFVIVPGGKQSFMVH